MTIEDQLCPGWTEVYSRLFKLSWSNVHRILDEDLEMKAAKFVRKPLAAEQKNARVHRLACRDMKEVYQYNTIFFPKSCYTETMLIQNSILQTRQRISYTRKIPGLWPRWLLIHLDNAAAHISIDIRQFSANTKMNTLIHSICRIEFPASYSCSPS